MPRPGLAARIFSGFARRCVVLPLRHAFYRASAPVNTAIPSALISPVTMRSAMSHICHSSEGRALRPAPMPRLCVTALSGGGGKTLLSLGLCRAFARTGLVVQPFKKGPDYIDAAWLRLAAGRPAANLDPYFLEAPRLRALFVHAMQNAATRPVENAPAEIFLPESVLPENILPENAPTVRELAAAAAGCRLLGLVEGNRGFFDGMDARGSCSTAELSRVLSCPVIISVDCTKMTRTAAALVRGMLHFEAGIRFAGVVLNQVGSSRHERILRQALEEHTDVPVLGALPRLAENPLPERHMGIASCGDSLSPQAQQVLDKLADFVEAHVDMPRVLQAAASAPPLEAEAFWPEPATAVATAVATATAIATAAGVGDGCALAFPAVAEAASHTDGRVASHAASHAAVRVSGGHAVTMPGESGVPGFSCVPVGPGGPGESGEFDESGAPSAPGARPRIGYVRDAALWFYYEENLEALRRAGADLVRLSLLDAEQGAVAAQNHKAQGAVSSTARAAGTACRAPWPQVDGLYLGGGFPEDHAEALSSSPLLGQLAAWAGQGMPIYAECGGFMVLSRGIEREKTVWPMSGILPVTAVFCPKPQGLGYVRGHITETNPFFAPGTNLRGHEFHYSRCRWEDAENWNHNSGHARWVMQLGKGQGMGPPPGAPTRQGADKGRGEPAPLRVDGLVFRNVWASYTHIFAPAAPGWAENFVSAARSFAAWNQSKNHE